VSQQNNTPRQQSAATWRSLSREFTRLATEENDQQKHAIMLERSRRSLLYVTLLGVYWTCEEPFRQEKDRRSAMVKDAWQFAADLYIRDPVMIRADETDLGFFCLFKTRGTSEVSRAKLESLAARAGIAIGGRKDTDDVYVWLHYVFDSLRRDSQELPEGSIVGQSRTGWLPRVSEASAILCSRLERQALVESNLESKPAEQLAPVAASPKKRGPKANMDFHVAVAKIVEQFGANWKAQSNLEEIATRLDDAKVPASPAWARRKPPAQSWRRAFRQYPGLVIKAIAYHLKMAARVSR
jgi:hypothetical protein